VNGDALLDKVRERISAHVSNGAFTLRQTNWRRRW
jgi:hypothetical protein